MNALLIGTSLALTLGALAATSLRGATPGVESPALPFDVSQGTPGDRAEDMEVEWRGSLAEALDEARRTRRPLLAVFR